MLVNIMVDQILRMGEHGDAGGGNRAALRCVCGHRILCEVRFEGGHVVHLRIFDDEPASETCSQRVKGRPGCGEQSALPLFFRKNRIG